MSTLADARRLCRTSDAAMLGAIQRLRLICSTDICSTEHADTMGHANAPAGEQLAVPCASVVEAVEVSKISMIAT